MKPVMIRVRMEALCVSTHERGEVMRFPQEIEAQILAWDLGRFWVSCPTAGDLGLAEGPFARLPVMIPKDKAEGIEP